MATQWLTTDQYAEKLQLHPQHVREMCATERLRAEKVGGVWRIPYVEPEDYQAELAVRDAVKATMRPCLAVINAAIGELEKMREGIVRVEEELCEQ